MDVGAGVMKTSCPSRAWKKSATLRVSVGSEGHGGRKTPQLSLLLSLHLLSVPSDPVRSSRHRNSVLQVTSPPVQREVERGLLGHRAEQECTLTHFFWHVCVCRYARIHIWDVFGTHIFLTFQKRWCVLWKCLTIGLTKWKHQGLLEYFRHIY